MSDTPLKIVNPNIERRMLSLEMRATMVDDKPVIDGVAAVYNQETVIGGMFREKILPGFFAGVLAADPDVIAADNHDWADVLGRTTNGTLRLSDVPEGLRYSIDINPDDPEAMSLYAKVQRGDINQSSFAFSVKVDQWEQPADQNTLPLRTLVECAELIDISPCTFGAYPQTSAGVRAKLSEFQSQPSDDQAVMDAAARAQVQAHMVNRRRMLDLLEIA
jgi:HK97 family phage prohead protease